MIVMMIYIYQSEVFVLYFIFVSLVSKSCVASLLDIQEDLDTIDRLIADAEESYNMWRHPDPYIGMIYDNMFHNINVLFARFWMVIMTENWLEQCLIFKCQYAVRSEFIYSYVCFNNDLLGRFLSLFLPSSNTSQS